MSHSSALKRGPVSSPILAGVLEGNRIESDFEQASLLIQIVKHQPLDATTRGPFFAALDTVDSDYEHRRVLSALAERTDLAAETVAAMLESSIDIQSDFEMASFLLDIARRASIDGPLRAPFFRALDTVGSTFERGRVLQAVVRRAGVAEETVLAALRSTAGHGLQLRGRPGAPGRRRVAPVVARRARRLHRRRGKARGLRTGESAVGAGAERTAQMTQSLDPNP